MADVLLVEPDDGLVRDLVELLEAHGHRLFVVDTAAGARDAITGWEPDCVILELELPDQDGMRLVGMIGQLRRPPGLIVATRRVSTLDAILSLQRGADDFVRKPYDSDELVARLDRVLSRTTRIPAPPSRSLFTVGELTLDVARVTVRVADEGVHLSRSEFQVLLTLAQHRGDIVTRAELCEALYGRDDPIGQHTVEVHLGRMRKKLLAAGGRGLIHTVRGHGYCLAAERK